MNIKFNEFQVINLISHIWAESRTLPQRLEGVASGDAEEEYLCENGAVEVNNGEN